MFFVGLALNCGVALAITDEEVDFVSKYKPHFQTLKDFYSNIEIAAIRTFVVPEKNNEFPQTLRLFLREGGYMKIELSQDYFDLQGQKQHSTRVTTISPKGRYSFSRGRVGDSFGLASYDKDNPAYDLYSIAPFAIAPFSANAVSLKEYLIDPHYAHEKRTVKDMVSNFTDHSENDIRKLSFTISDPLSKTEFDLAYNLNWVVLRAKEESFSDDVMSSCFETFIKNLEIALTRPRPSLVSVIEYEGDVDGIPLIKTLTRTTFDSQGQIVAQEVYDIQEIKPGAPAESVFDPRQYLPPGFDFSTLDSGWTTMSWTQIAGIIISILLITWGLGLRLWTPKKHENKQ